MLSFMLRVYTIYIKNAPHIRYRGTIKNVLGCLYRWCLLGGLFWFVFPNNLMAQYFYRKGLHCIQKLTVGFTRYIKKRYAIQRYNVMNSSAERSLPLMPTWRFDLFFPDNMFYCRNSMNITETLMIRGLCTKEMREQFLIKWYWKTGNLILENNC